MRPFTVFLTALCAVSFAFCLPAQFSQSRYYCGTGELGRAVAHIDIDKDGYLDLILGGVNAVWAYSGRDGTPIQDWSPLAPPAGYHNVNFGYSLARMSDDELLVGAPGGDDVFLIDVTTRQPTRTIDTFNGGSLGWAVCRVADFDGGGKPDIAAGAPRYNFSAGRVRVYSTETGNLLKTYNSPGGFVGFGMSLATLGNVAEPPQGVTAVDDFVIGGGWIGSTGVVQVISGETQAPLWTVLGANLGVSLFGSSVARVGDLDGDGRGEVVAGAPGATPGPGLAGAGRVYVLDGDDGSVEDSHDGSVASQQLGFSVCGGGDFDGDGTPDYGYGTPGSQFGGRVEVRSGADCSLLMSVDRPAGEGFGRVTALGDLDGDGKDEFVAGAPFSAIKTTRGGEVRAYSYGFPTADMVLADAGVGGVPSLVYVDQSVDWWFIQIPSLAVASSWALPVGCNDITSIDAADYNGDGLEEGVALACASGEVVKVDTLVPPSQSIHGFFGSPTAVLAAPIDNVLGDDLLVADGLDLHNLSAFPQVLPVLFVLQKLVAVDLDGDADQDVVGVAHEAIALIENLGGGNLQVVNYMAAPLGQQFDRGVVTDSNVDGLVDLAVSYFDSATGDWGVHTMAAIPGQPLSGSRFVTVSSQSGFSSGYLAAGDMDASTIPGFYPGHDVALVLDAGARNTLDYHSPAPTTRLLNSWGSFPLGFGDIDSDGLPELLVVKAGSFVSDSLTDNPLAQVFGTPCGPTGSATISASALPVAGTSISVNLTNAAPSATALLFPGVGPAQHPLDGSVCTTWIDPLGFNWLTLADGSGSASVPLPPLDPGWLGFNGYFQWITLAPGSIFLDVSAGLRLRIGS